MNDRALRRTLAGVVVAVPAALSASGAAAAPQVLALFSTDRPVALACAGDACRAELPTLCLQPGRRVPTPGRSYRLADGQSLSLVGRTADGREVSLVLDRRMTIAASRTHVAVTVSIPRALLDRHGLEGAAIAVGGNVSAIPVVSAQDRRPQTAGEIAAATGHGRRLATAIVDREPDRMPAVRLMTRLSNALPAGDRDAVWASMVAGAKADGVSAAAIGFARFNYELCGFKTANRIVASFRQCLRGLSDDSMEFLNADLEPALGSGS